MFCPNCMSPYVQPFTPPEPAEGEDAEKPESPEQLLECTECEYVGVVTEFVPENYR